MKNEVYVGNKLYYVEEKDIQEFEKSCNYRFCAEFLRSGIEEYKDFDKTHDIHMALVKAAELLNYEDELTKLPIVGVQEGCVDIDENGNVIIVHANGDVEPI